ncbi:hypothetical protein CC1G_06114 [Coprinopsis cinerea okayama7|uniref:Hydrophobin n=1 Tax=Coprinopsis cinerea (strain Okayama-7 / 130 / ATCC MYA-4618 / FGSC 9003) TaxID=240176 RepID=A8PA76_COPC7|nr:hypothetical protein CC1G_06114 [Coprinopsis cinerea okayama7\|eukprot:XP_001839924.1 hypothetical protein CC1G_06114 [Coprinopsis cinerea okayama7\
MFARLTTALVAFTLVSAVVANPAPTEIEYEQCEGGTVQCCASYQKATDLNAEWTKWLGFLNINARQVDANVGFTCTGVKAGGIGGAASCTQQKLCCTNSNFNGVVAIGCTPILSAL